MPATPEAPSDRDDPWSDVLAAWAIAIGLAYLSWRFLPEGAAWLAITAAWVGVPLAAQRLRRRPVEELGLAWRAPRRGLALVAVYAVVFLPLYALGFFSFYGPAGWRVPGLETPLVAFVGALFFAGLPEEIFFRGLVQTRLKDAYPRAPARVLGVPLSLPIVAAAALFAATHAAFLSSPFSAEGLERLTTFFPGLLFGALREETGDVTASAIFHAMCNAWLATLHQGYLV